MKPLVSQMIYLQIIGSEKLRLFPTKYFNVQKEQQKEMINIDSKLIVFIFDQRYGNFRQVIENVDFIWYDSIIYVP